MPYIKQEKRDILDPEVMKLFTTLLNLQVKDDSNDMGENLSYIFTKLLKQCYGETNGELVCTLGVLSAVQHEVHRRVAVTHNDQQMYDNGDIDKLT